MDPAAVIIDPCVIDLAAADLLTHVAFGEYISCQKDRADIFLQPRQALDREPYTQVQFGQISFRVMDLEWTGEDIQLYFNLQKFRECFLEPLLADYLGNSQKPIVAHISQDLEMLQDLAQSIGVLPVWLEDASPEQIRFMTIASDLVQFVQEFIRAKMQTDDGTRVVQRLLESLQ